MSERARLGLLSLLLLLTLGCVAFGTSSTIQAVQRLQQQNAAIKKGDVNAVRPWMTVHVISRLYHVPEDYLYQSLNIDHPDLYHRVTLNQIASKQRRPVSRVIQAVQHAILQYRKDHTRMKTLTPQPTRSVRRHVVMKPER